MSGEAVEDLRADGGSFLLVRLQNDCTATLPLAESF
jgi:hypothetical protein